MTPTTDETTNGRPPLAVIFAITVTGITVNTLITASIPDILDGLGAATGLAGVLVSAATLPGILLAPVIGVLADRFGRREVIVPCLVLFAVAGGAASLAPNLAVLAVLRFLQGAGSAGLVNLAIVLIGDHWEGTERARLIGRNAAVLTVCLALFPALGGLLTDLGSWRTPFLVYPLALLTAVAVWTRLPVSARREGSVGDQLREALPYLRTRRIAAIMLGTVAVFALVFGYKLTVLPVYIEEAFGLGPSWRGLILGVPAIGSMAVASNLGRLTVRFGRRRLLVAGTTFITLSLVVLALAPTLTVLLVGALTFGLGEGAIVPALQDLATGAAPASSRGTLVATMVSAARLGQTMGPLGASAAFDATGALWAFAGGAVLAALVLGPLLNRAAVPEQTTP